MKYHIIAILGLSLCILIACKSGKSVTNEEHQPNEAKNSQESPIAQLNESYINKRMEIKGYYSGFSGKDCRFPDAVCSRGSYTKSDWLFSDGISCIYVTGGNPRGLSPYRAEDLYKPIKLICIVKSDKNGKLYLKQITSINNF